MVLFVLCYLVSTRVAVVPDGPAQPAIFIIAMLLFAMFAAALRLLPAAD